MDSRSLQGIAGGNANTPRVQTLNYRLNRALDRIESEADRIERCLGRINGTPNAKEVAAGTLGQAQIAQQQSTVGVRIGSHAARAGRRERGELGHELA